VSIEKCDAAGQVRNLRRQWQEMGMKDLTCTNDAVFISWLHAELGCEDIPAVVLDTDASIVEGSIPAIPHSVIVPNEEFERARMILADGERLRHEAAIEHG
jgi:hypothetical protein